MSYQVLARKYRPANFKELVGQEVLVTTLENAIANKKIAHAFILTGIRGVGKTTTARIIAKALNCIGEDGKALEARTPCEICSNCQAIAASRHADVIEIDAASKTGVDDMRSIIDSVQYSPAIGRYKIYIIDEVHMLSNSAFNALLKTLEEPPAHVKFIFATTEIRKVPITVLSRCQRFDLRRLNTAELSEHLKNILQKENFEAESQALNLIAEAADGSVRDLLSVTDRILSHNNYQAKLPASAVEEVLGLNDKNKIIDLFTAIFAGNVVEAIAQLEKFNEISTDITSLIDDLQKITHIITLSKTIPGYQLNSFSTSAQEKIKDLASKASLTDLTRIWQMLLKGSVEVANSPSQTMAMEMLLIRICHLADLPNLEKIIAGNVREVKDVKNVALNKNSSQDLIGEVIRNFPGSKVEAGPEDTN
ncbi:MAG: polymerase subunit gamma and tau [Rickettsiaceae bacterium]|jgi:DNA polymerase-3 subunit gamma/tau|nr:polymerase subunit gamma and tau [Rickettsiaceae bacterium]